MSRWYRYDVLSKLETLGLCQTVNASSVEDHLHIAEALLEGGISNIEILQRSGPEKVPKVDLDAIYELRKRFPEALVGAGTVQTRERSQAVIDYGAQFVVSNLTNEGVIETANLNCVLTIPGTQSGTDVRTAMRLGCWIVKLFVPLPKSAVNAEINWEYLRQFLGCFPRLQFLLTGGIAREHASGYLRTGFAVLVPGGIVSEARIERRAWSEITEAAKRYVEEVRKAKEVSK